MARKMSKEQQQIPTEQEVSLGIDEESLSPEEAQSKIAMLLTKAQNLEMLSETTEEEVKLISALSTIANNYNMGLLNGYLKSYLQLKVSLHRQGRKEIQEIAKPSPETEQRQKAGLRQLLLGGGRV
jgi:hypothetical protein